MKRKQRYYAKRKANASKANQRKTTLLKHFVGEREKPWIASFEFWAKKIPHTPKSTLLAWFFRERWNISEDFATKDNEMGRKNFFTRLFRKNDRPKQTNNCAYMEIRHHKYRKPADQHIFTEWSIKNKFIKVKTNTPARKIAWTGRTLKSQAKIDYRRTVYSNAIFVRRVENYVPATLPTKNRGVTRSSRSNPQWN